MPDVTRFLPLSQRPAGDESDVRNDWRPALGAVVAQAATLVAAAPAGAGAALADAFADTARLRSEFEALSAHDCAQQLHALAAAVRSGRRRSIRALAAGVRGLLVMARDLHTEVDLDPTSAGAVALWAAATAPLERRAVVDGHTVRASDAGWAFGHGPALTGPATSIAAFLLGVSDTPPQPVTGR